MSDLLDVVHYLFEKDRTAMEKDHARARDNMRSSIYVNLYGQKEYKWKMDDESGSTELGSDIDLPMDSADKMAPATLPKYEHKPFIPATPMDVDSPLPVVGLREAPLG